MRILSITIYSKYDEKNPIILGSTDELSFVSIFQRGTVREFIKFHSRLVVQRTGIDQNLEVALEKGICYSIGKNCREETLMVFVKVPMETE